MIFDIKIKTEIRFQRKNQLRKNIRHSGVEPGSPGHKSTTLTNKTQELSIEDSEVKILFCIHKSISF